MIQKYSVQWDCPHCGNSHNWWWDCESEACSDCETTMVCDRCMVPTKCKGDGHGFYEPIVEVKKDEQRSLETINLTLDELQLSRRTHLSMISKLSERADELDDLNTDVHNYCRNLEDKLNEKTKLIFDTINSLLARLRALEDSNVEKRVKDLEGLEEHMNNRLLKVEQRIDKKPPSVLDLIHGVKPSFHERLREECGFTKETLDGETIAKMVRFVAVEVEKMTERDMGGSFSVSNIEVARRLRELAADAQVEDYNYDPDEEDEEPGWGLYGFEGQDE